MNRIFAALILALFAAAAYAKCTTRTVVLPGGPVIHCTTCCDSSGNCTTNCT